MFTKNRIRQIKSDLAELKCDWNFKILKGKPGNLRRSRDLESTLVTKVAKWLCLGHFWSLLKWANTFWAGCVICMNRPKKPKHNAPNCWNYQKYLYFNWSPAAWGLGCVLSEVGRVWLWPPSHPWPSASPWPRPSCSCPQDVDAQRRSSASLVQSGNQDLNRFSDTEGEGFQVSWHWHSR